MQSHIELNIFASVYTEWQWPLSGVHSIMMEKFAQPGEGGEVHADTLSLYLPSRTKLRCMLQLKGQIHSPKIFYSIHICTLWLKLRQMGTQGVHTYERYPSVVGSVSSSCRFKRFLSCLGRSSRPSKKYFVSSSYIIFLTLSPSPSKVGRQSCRVARLLICVSG